MTALHTHASARHGTTALPLFWQQGKAQAGDRWSLLWRCALGREQGRADRRGCKQQCHGGYGSKQQCLLCTAWPDSKRAPGQNEQAQARHAAGCMSSLTYNNRMRRTASFHLAVDEPWSAMVSVDRH
jgi:hypothetical protein